MGASQVDGMRNFFDTNVIPQFWAPPAQVGSVPSHVEGGMIDPNSIVPGLGFGAADIPVPPSMQETMQLLEMYQNLAGQQQNDFNQLLGQTLNKKEKVFENHHYQFDPEGNPVIDEKTGKPKVFEGAEDIAGKIQRKAWEMKIQEELGVKHREEFAAFSDSANTVIETIQNDQGSVFDFDKRNQHQQTLDKLQNRENELVLSHKKATLDALCGHLPDPDNPGQILASSIDQGFAAFENQSGSIEDQISNTELGQKFQNYFSAVQQFLDNQQQIWSAFNVTDFDPNAMSNFATEMKRNQRPV